MNTTEYLRLRAIEFAVEEIVRECPREVSDLSKRDVTWANHVDKAMRWTIENWDKALTRVKQGCAGFSYDHCWHQIKTAGTEVDSRLFGLTVLVPWSDIRRALEDAVERNGSQQMSIDEMILGMLTQSG